MAHRPTDRLPPAHSHSLRLAWWIAFAATVALIALLDFARSADAATLPAPAGPAPAALVESESEFDEGAEEGEEGAEVGQECGEEAEECTEEGERAGDDEALAPDECRLSQTDAEVTLSSHGKMRLTIRYTAHTSTMVAIEYSLRGPRGSLRMDGERRRFTGTGSLHETERLTSVQTARALAARSFKVELRPLGAPGYCHTYFDQHLTVKRSTPHGPVWLDPETTFRVPGHR